VGGRPEELAIRWQLLKAHPAPHCLYSLVQSCKLIDVPPFEYLKDGLAAAPSHRPINTPTRLG
jgi:hypothetical protein